MSDVDTKHLWLYSEKAFLGAKEELIELCNVLLLYAFKKQPDIVGFIQNNCPVWGQILMNDHVITISAVFTDNVTSRLCRIYHASSRKTRRTTRQKIAASEPAGRGLSLCLSEIQSRSVSCNLTHFTLIGNNKKYSMFGNFHGEINIDVLTAT